MYTDEASTMSSRRRSLAALLALVLIATLLEASIQPRQAYAAGCGVVGYSYDSNGRLTGVMDPAGQTARYQYDDFGNTTNVWNLGTPTLSVLSLVPAHGPAGTAVTISGGCFASQPSANSVWFNGTPATVTLASATRLVALVPPGASSGSVTVAANGASAVSSTVFAVDPTVPLAIGQVTPSVVNTGATLTVAGSGFEAQGLDVDTNVAAVNGMRARILAASANQLSVEVPASATSGRLAIRTKRGTVLGPDVIVAPAPYTAADVFYSTRLAVGSSILLGVPGNKIDLVLFDLAKDARASITFYYGSFAACGSARVLDPHGSVAGSLGCAGTGTVGHIDQFTARVAGTHSLVFAAPTTSGTVGVAVNSVPPDAQATTSVNGPPATVAMPSPFQNAAVTFTGTAGQVVNVNLTGNSLSSASLAVRKSDSTLLASTDSGPGNVTFYNLHLSTTGTYRILVNPYGTVTGQITASVVRVSGPAGALASTTIAAAPVLPARDASADPSADVLDSRRSALRDRLAADPSETWIPDRFTRGGQDWRSHRPAVPVPAPLAAAPGQTAVTGHVLTLSGQPLPGVTLRIDERSTRTDHTGRFRLSGLPAGHHELTIDGRTAGRRGRQFGVYEVGVDVVAGQTLALPYTIWMTLLDTANAVRIPSPTTADTVLTNPNLPGFEVRLPKGSVVTDHDGEVVTELSITPIPVDRPPFPLPPGVVTPAYFTVQPGGSYVYPRGAQIVYPNTTGLPAGIRVEFWDYDAQGRGWHVYGHGSVTADRRQIVPDPDVRVWEFTGAMINVPGLLGAAFNSLNDFLAHDGDPVDLATGLFHERHTDLAVPDIMPISVTRSYRQLDNAMRPFGIGTNHDYGIFLQSAQQYQEADLVFPDSSKVHFVRTSPGGHWTDAVFAAVDTTGPFRNATMNWNGLGWDLVRADGTVYVFGMEQPLQAIRDRHGNEITLIRTNGQAGNITQVISPNGRWLRFFYDAGNRITQAIDDASRSVSYVYDSAGRLTQVWKGSSTYYGYDNANRMTTITDHRGITYLTNFYDAAGKVSAQRSADGLVTSFGYVTDASGYSTQTTVTDPAGGSRRVTFDANHYEATDSVAAGTRTITTLRDPVTRQVLRITDPYGRATTFGYDAAGSATTVTNPAGRTTTIAHGGPYQQVSSVTDWGGRTTRFGYNPAGDRVSVTDAAGRTTSTVYDAAGRPIAVTDAAGRSTIAYDPLGEPVTGTDPLGRTTRTAYDRVGNIREVTGPDGAATWTYHEAMSGQLWYVRNPAGTQTSLGYDANGNLISSSVHARTTSYSYDSRDRLISRTDPLGAVSQVAYDALDRPVWARDPRGRVTTYQYDTLGRLGSIRYGVNPDSSAESWTNHEYDAFDRLSRVIDSHGGTTTYTYDSLDQLTSALTPTGWIQYTYDNLSRRQTMTATGATPVSYTYDQTDLISTLTQGSTTASWQRDAAGRTTRIQQPGLTTSYAYDAASQLTALSLNSPSGAAIGNLWYTYDIGGRVASVSGNLAQVTIPATSPAVAYNAGNQLTTRGGVPLGYDAAGNLVHDGTNTYTWNARGQLNWITRPGMTAQYTYDSYGRRTFKTVNGVTASYLYDGSSIVREQSGAAAIQRLTAGPDRTLVRTENGTARALVTDRLGSTLGLVDPASSALATRYGYDPYGVPTQSGAPSTNTQQYTGRDSDAETGLHNNRLRYYSPALGRFISQDPADLGGGSTNLYEYAHTDPVNLSDPNGDCPLCALMLKECAWGALSGVVLGGILARANGRKYSIGNGLRDAAQGCVTGSLFSLTGVGFVGQFVNRVKSALAKRIPVFNVVAGIRGFGFTDGIGRITVKAGLNAADYAETVLHEAVHSFVTRVAGSRVSTFLYTKCVICRVAEEAVAETVGTFNPIKGLRYPFVARPPYVSGPEYVQLLGELAVIDTVWQFTHQR
jgi:RHS repeat-associated protein